MTAPATLETFYHAVAILSCRPRYFRAQPRLFTAHTRQSLSALRITSDVGTDNHHRMPLLPFIPYAVSLSMSVSYLELRHSMIAIHRSRFRTELWKNCEILEVLGHVFPSASAMADMGKAILNEVDRIVSVVACSGNDNTQEVPSTQAASRCSFTGLSHPPTRLTEGKSIGVRQIS